MKKSLLFCALAAFALTGCPGGHDDDDAPLSMVITASNVDGTTTNVAQVGFDVGFVDGWSSSGVIAGSRAALPPAIELRADFKNGGFTLILPPLDDRYLFNLTEMFDEQDDMSGFISSDPKVRVFGLNEEDFYAFNLTGSPIGTVFYGKDVEYWRVGTVRGGLIYADRAVTITGVNKQAKGTDDHHDLKLKKGWNRTARTKLADVGNRDQYMISTTFAASELNWKIVQE